MSVLNCCISQGSVATYLRCGGNYYTRFVGNFFLFTAVARIFFNRLRFDEVIAKVRDEFFWDTV